MKACLIVAGIVGGTAGLVAVWYLLVGLSALWRWSGHQ